MSQGGTYRWTTWGTHQESPRDPEVAPRGPSPDPKWEREVDVEWGLDTSGHRKNKGTVADTDPGLGGNVRPRTEVGRNLSTQAANGPGVVGVRRPRPRGVCRDLGSQSRRRHRVGGEVGSPDGSESNGSTCYLYLYSRGRSDLVVHPSLGRPWRTEGFEERIHGGSQSG